MSASSSSKPLQARVTASKSLSGPLMASAVTGRWTGARAARGFDCFLMGPACPEKGTEQKKRGDLLLDVLVADSLASMRTALASLPPAPFARLVAVPLSSSDPALLENLIATAAMVSEDLLHFYVLPAELEKGKDPTTRKSPENETDQKEKMGKEVDENVAKWCKGLMEECRKVIKKERQRRQLVQTMLWTVQHMARAVTMGRQCNQRGNMVYEALVYACFHSGEPTEDCSRKASEWGFVVHGGPPGQRKAERSIVFAAPEGKQPDFFWGDCFQADEREDRFYSAHTFTCLTSFTVESNDDRTFRFSFFLPRMFPFVHCAAWLYCWLSASPSLLPPLSSRCPRLSAALHGIFDVHSKTVSSSPCALQRPPIGMAEIPLLVKWSVRLNMPTLRAKHLPFCEFLDNVGRCSLTVTDPSDSYSVASFSFTPDKRVDGQFLHDSVSGSLIGRPLRRGTMTPVPDFSTVFILTKEFRGLHLHFSICVELGGIQWELPSVVFSCNLLQDPAGGERVEIKILRVEMGLALQAAVRASGYGGMFDQFIEHFSVSFRIAPTVDDPQSKACCSSLFVKLPRSRVFSVAMRPLVDRYFRRIFELFEILNSLCQAVLLDFRSYL